MGNLMKSPGAENQTEGSLDATRKATEYDSLVVLSDYPSQDISEPIFRMGERLKGLAQEGCWWKVCYLQTETENYIPKNHVAKVYHGWLFEGVGRQKAEELLNLPGNTVGSFLIRESPIERGAYCLSVRYRAIKHYKILRLDNRWYYISPRLTFQCLEDMVNHYSDCSDGICCMLTAPCLTLSSNASTAAQAPPVVMRHDFNWKKVNRSQLLSPSYLSYGENAQNTVSYGVRSSISAYLSVAETEKLDKRNDRGKKSKSIYVMPHYSNTEAEESD